MKVNASEDPMPDGDICQMARRCGICSLPVAGVLLTAASFYVITAGRPALVSTHADGNRDAISISRSHRLDDESGGPFATLCQAQDPRHLSRDLPSGRRPLRLSRFQPAVVEGLWQADAPVSGAGCGISSDRAGSAASRAASGSIDRSSAQTLPAPCYPECHGMLSAKRGLTHRA